MSPVLTLIKVAKPQKVFTTYLVPSQKNVRNHWRQLFMFVCKVIMCIVLKIGPKWKKKTLLDVATFKCMQISSIALFRIQCIAPWSLGINIRLGINISIQNDNYQNNEETGIWYVAILIFNWFLMIYFFYFLGKTITFFN